MISLASLDSLNFSKNSVAPEKATWLMYFFISSAVMPMPLSDTVIVFAVYQRPLSLSAHPAPGYNDPAKPVFLFSAWHPRHCLPAPAKRSHDRSREIF